MRALTDICWAEGGTGNRKHRYIDIDVLLLLPVVPRDNETLFKLSFGTSESEHRSEENVLSGEGLLTWVH